MTTEERLQQLEDHQAIRELIDAYAFCADTRDAQGQMALFTLDTNFEVYYDEKSSTPSQVVSNRKDLFPIFDNLNTYLSTLHFNGQSTIKVDGNKATAKTYCRAYHMTMPEGKQTLMIAGIRYFDIIIKQEGKWLFAERKLKVCWLENR